MIVSNRRSNAHIRTSFRAGPAGHRTTQSIPKPTAACSAIFSYSESNVPAVPISLFSFPAHAIPPKADMPIMDERRIEARMLCAELVELRWRDKHGFERRETAHLEDISLSGACLQSEKPLLL